jgi:glucan biosynthesis protein C
LKKSLEETLFMDSAAGSAPMYRMERIHYLDQVRSYALLIGIFMHASHTYGEGFQNVWFITDHSRSFALYLGFFFLHLFRMPVFFFIAGFFANYLVHKNGVKGFVQNRLLRIGVPFAVFLPITLTGVAVLMIGSVLYLPKDSYGPVQRQVAAQFQKAAPQNGAKEPGPDAGATRPETAAVTENSLAAIRSDNMQDAVITQHLWFLYYLVFFCMAAALFRVLELKFLTKIISALYYVGIPAGTPGHVIPRLWPFGYYGVFFLLGWHFFHHRDYLDRIMKYLWPITVFGLLASLLYLSILAASGSSGNALASGMLASVGSIRALKWVAAILEAYASVFLVFACLLLGKRFLNIDSRAVRFVSDSSYWIYLIHFPMVTMIQVFLVPLEISIYVKFLLSTAAVFGIGLVSYRYIVRYSFIGLVLNGRRIRAQI